MPQGIPIMTLKQSHTSLTETGFHDWLVGDEQYSPCLHPWFSVFVLAAGWVSCCPQNKTRFGNVIETPIEELWNSEPAASLRRLLAEGRYEQAGCDPECPFLCGSFKGPRQQPPVEELIYPEFDRKNGSEVYRSNLRRLADAYRVRSERVEGMPVFIDIQTTVRCNSDCIMCGQPHKARIELPQEVMSDMNRLRETANWFRWQGGEVFVHKRFDAYLDAFEDGRWPQLRRYVITNGTLLNEQRMEMFVEVEKPVFFLLSLDGASKDVYEKTRRGLEFDKVVGALERLADIQRKTGRTDLIKWNYVVMKDTVSDMKNAMDRAEAMGVDLNFAPIQGKYPEQNIFRYSDLMTRPMDMFDELQAYSTAKSVTISGFEGIYRRLQNREESVQENVGIARQRR
jgi:MoaA/NifB/PqqE/SkfB family radical SAM enzyme